MIFPGIFEVEEENEELNLNEEIKQEKLKHSVKFECPDNSGIIH